MWPFTEVTTMLPKQNKYTARVRLWELGLMLENVEKKKRGHGIDFFPNNLLSEVAYKKYFEI